MIDRIADTATKTGEYSARNARMDVKLNPAPNICNCNMATLVLSFIAPPQRGNQQGVA